MIIANQIAGINAWPVLLYLAFTIAMAGIAYRDLLEFEEAKVLAHLAEVDPNLFLAKPLSRVIWSL